MLARPALRGTLIALLGLVACNRPRATEVPVDPTPAVVAPADDAAARAAILAASDLPDVQPTPRPDDPMGVTIHRLGNGMTVYISPERQAPRFAAWIAVRAGSRHDPPNSTGLAH
jgi:hypothetical protein